MGMASVSHNNWTVAKLHALPDDGKRHEIIDGVLYVTPSPAWSHQVLLSRLFLLIGPYCQSVGIDAYFSPADLRSSERTVVQPDLFVVPRIEGEPIREFPRTSSLLLVVEALSRSTARRDRTIKRELYQSQGVPEYWIVDGGARAIERWRPGLDAPEILQHTLVWHPVPAHEPLEVDLPDYFRRALGEPG